MSGQIRTVDDIKNLGTILGIWAHPDDETFTSAGIMAAAVQNGQQVICVTATKGEAGVKDEVRWPAERLGEIRAKELEVALKIIGIRHHYWLGFKDGLCNPHEDKAIQSICSIVEQLKPDTILTFGEEGMTGHPDHKAVCNWAVQASQRTTLKPVIYHAVQTVHQYEDYLHTLDEAFDIFFNIDEPILKTDEQCDILFELNKEARSLKFSALEAMPSQTEAMLSTFDKDFICAALSPEAFVRAR